MVGLLCLGGSSNAEEVNFTEGSITLLWDANDPIQYYTVGGEVRKHILAGYKLYYGLSTRNYPHVIDVGNQTTYTITGLQTQRKYFIAATAYSTEDIESDYSNEVDVFLKESVVIELLPATEGRIRYEKINQDTGLNVPGGSRYQFNFTWEE